MTSVLRDPDRTNTAFMTQRAWWLAGLNLLVPGAAQVLAGNDASCRVLDKLGMVNEGVRRRHIRKGKKLHDIVMFGLLREEWNRR